MMFTTLCFIIFFVVTLRMLLGMVDASITFAATSNVNLETYGLPPSRFIHDIDSILRNTSSYKSYYEPPVQDAGDFYDNGPSSETVTLPNVILIRGSDDFSKSNDNNNSRAVVLPTHSGLIGTVSTAYNLHHNLQLRPDDFWVTILGQFSSYVNARAETLRDQFVSHEGKIELEVEAMGNIYVGDFATMTLSMLNLIAANIKDNSLREWFLPGFTTTTPTDNVCAAASAMCALQEYFTYKFSFICGIPEVTLLGTVEDWKLLRCKIDRLLDFDDDTHILSEWVALLRIIGDNLVESSMNGSQNNLHFWDTIVNHVGGGSGPSYINGWISTFSFFDKDGNPYSEDRSNDFWPMIDTEDINPNVLSCPVDIDDNGVPYNSTMFVGQMAFQAIEESTIPAAVDPGSVDPVMRLQPRNDWALAISDGFISLPLRSPEESDDDSNDFGVYQRDWECEAGPNASNESNFQNNAVDYCSLNDTNSSSTTIPPTNLVSTPTTTTTTTTTTTPPQQSTQTPTSTAATSLSTSESQKSEKSNFLCIAFMFLFSSLFQI